MVEFNYIYLLKMILHVNIITSSYNDIIPIIHIYSRNIKYETAKSAYPILERYYKFNRNTRTKYNKHTRLYKTKVKNNNIPIGDFIMLLCVCESCLRFSARGRFTLCLQLLSEFLELALTLFGLFGRKCRKLLCTTNDLFGPEQFLGGGWRCVSF
jgi:hypothetical protein